MHFGGLEDNQEDSTAPHITFRPHTGGHRQCGLAICTFHRGFSLASGIELREDPNLHARAMQIAGQLRQGAVYDAHYLALADILGCEYWTADERFYRAAAPVSQRVRWIGEFPAPE